MQNNRPVLKSRRKELRNNATNAEKILWKMLQHSKLDGYKFRRQHSVGPYILDFYCPSEKLAVEVDGDSHFTDDAIEYDQERTAYLNGLEIRVVRFLNTDVYDNLDAVCERILEEIAAERSLKQNI
ncbi:MAG: endonuclease domain-containing protein [Deltaproteobacteria bacterium]|nr:endonuclease domain-containing protein [Deltaproteobacteria bacterium]TLN02876.1 MAG: endonuclease domain-containing protein [bacterium]